MRLAAIDWIIIAVFIIFITAIGIIASRKAAGKKEDFLVAGRNVGLYVVLASVVAGEWGAITMVYQAEAGYLNGLSAMFLGITIFIGSVLAGMGGWFSVWVRRVRIMTIPELMEFLLWQGSPRHCRSCHGIRVFDHAGYIPAGPGQYVRRIPGRGSQSGHDRHAGIGSDLHGDRRHVVCGPDRSGPVFDSGSGHPPVYHHRHQRCRGLGHALQRRICRSR